MRKALAVLVLVVVLVGAYLLAVGGGEPGGTVEVVGVTLKSGLSTFDVVEADPGIMEGTGVNITILRVNVPPQVIDALTRGDAQLAVLPVELAGLAMEKGADVYIVALDNQMNQAILTRPGTGVESPRDLAGKKVAAVVGSGTYALFTAFMKELYGYTVGPEGADIIIVNLPPANVIDALVSGEVDAAVIWEPLVSKAVVEEGMVIVANFTDLWRQYSGSDTAPMLVWVAAGSIVEDEDVLQAIQEIHARAAEKWNNERDWTIELLSRLYNLPAQTAEMVWERNQMYTGTCITGEIKESMLEVWRLAVEAGYLQDMPPAERIVTCQG